MKEIDNISVFGLRMIKEREVNYEVAGKKVSRPDILAEILDEVFEMGSLCEEIMALICLDTKNQIIGMFQVSHGSINASIVHPREIYKRAVLANANSIIIAHNHPSGDTTPSDEDLNITRRLKDAGDLLGIKLLDHIIIGHTSYLSFKEKNLI